MQPTRLLILSIIAGGIVGCVGPAPIEDYTMARAALTAAQRSGASGSAPGLFADAEENYKKAQEAFKDREYDEARQLFARARQSAEKAENVTRLKKFDSGEVGQ